MVSHVQPVESPKALENAAEDPRNNLLLKAFPEDAWDRIKAHVELIEMPLGRVLYEYGDRLRHVYFPSTCILSLLYLTEDGESAAIGVIGREGLLGDAPFMGGGTLASRPVVQSGGTAYRLCGSHLKQEFREAAPVRRLLLRYTQALMTQLSQTVACNRHHNVEQQFSRWVLMSMDRLSSSELVMTQELIANMLGVRRESVTAAAGKLQKLGLITYRRGRITVLDRPALEARTCECYGVVRREYDRLLPTRPNRPPAATTRPKSPDHP